MAEEGPASLLLLQREIFLEVAGRLRAAQTILLRTVCRTCADWAGDATLNAALIEREDWTADFKALSPRLLRLASIAPACARHGSVESQYLRQRWRLRRLVQTLPETLQTWRMGDAGASGLASLIYAASLATQVQGTLAREDPAHANPFVAQATESAHQEADGQAAAGVDVESDFVEHDCVEGRLHLVGDLVEILANGTLPWRCGSLLLFDRFDCIAMAPYHDVNLVVETGETDSTLDSDDEDPSSVQRFPAALADWSLSQFSKAQATLAGKPISLTSEDDELLLNPMPRPTDGEEGGILLIGRGTNSFASKVQNAAMGGYTGVVVCDNQDGPLFRMAGGPSADSESLPPAVLLEKQTGEALRALRRAGPVKIRRLEMSTKCRAFICIGGSSPRASRDKDEIWIVADPRTDNLGQVLLVQDCKTATVLAHTLSDFLADIVRLDSKNAERLKRLAPRFLKSSQSGNGNDTKPASDRGSHRPGRSVGAMSRLQAGSDNFAMAAFALLMNTSPGPDANPFASLRSLDTTTPGHGFGELYAASWDSQRSSYCLHLSRRVKRSWIHISGGDQGPQKAQVLMPIDDMGLDALLEAADVTVGLDAESVYISANDMDLLKDECILLEEQCDKPQAASSTLRLMTPRRGFRGASAMFERIKRIAPGNIQQRWESMSDTPTGIVSCVVSFRGGQLIVKWSDSSGDKGSFQKPLRNTYDTFVEIAAIAHRDHVVRSGDTVLILQPEAVHDDSSTCVNESPAEQAVASGWEEDRGLDEPDGGWCLRQRSGPLDEGSSQQDEGYVFEVDEEFVLLKARPNLHGGPPETFALDEEHERSHLMPRPWSMYVALEQGLRGFPDREQRADAPDEPEAPPAAPLEEPSESAGSAGSEGAGSMASARRATDSSDMEEHPATSSNTASGAELFPATSAAPSYRLEATGSKQLVLEISFPGARSAADLELDISGMSARVTDAAGRLPVQEALEVSFPFQVLPSSAKARFNRSRGLLIVQLQGADAGTSDSET
eukprot:TRINITY_DN78544_c0_g1_i2.p1 TRINITY_DN78544_c0_g1~~TRINITY_DN78544_c0_g1_i2.p1  ORF type:complete len:1023 (-),score=201.49 TRINITY_DN78544_c0_g1_i2:37-3069(-)